MIARMVTAVIAAIGVVVLVSEVDGEGRVFSFDQFSVRSVYRGPTRLPDFKGRDREFSSYRTRIRTELRAGPNFAGHYSVVQWGCGTGCLVAVVADNKTGQVFKFPRSGEMDLDLEFKLGSRLLIAQWENVDQDECNLEYFEWAGGEPKLLETKILGNREVCWARLKRKGM